MSSNQLALFTLHLDLTTKTTLEMGEFFLPLTCYVIGFDLFFLSLGKILVNKRWQ